MILRLCRFASIMDMIYPMMPNTPGGHAASTILGIFDAVLDYINNELREVDGKSSNIALFLKSAYR